MTVDDVADQVGGLDALIELETRALSAADECLPQVARDYLRDDTAWSDAPAEYWEWLLARHRDGAGEARL